MRKMDAEEFVAHVEGLKEKSRVAANNLVVGIVLECIENVVVGGEFSPGTPVDVGYARAGWWLSLDGDGAPPVLPEFDEKSRGKDHIPLIEPDVASMQIALLDLRQGLPRRISLNSNVVYIVPLENGWSQQAPVGMVRQTANALPAIVAKVKAQQGWTK